MIVGIFTAIQFILNVMREKRSEYLLLINCVVFAVAMVGTILYGFTTNTLDLSRYSPGQVLAELIVIGGTIFLYMVSKWVIDTKRKWYHYIGILFGTVAVSAFVLMIVSPQLYNLFFSSFFSFFGQQAVTNTVQEARAWSWASAVSAFGYGLILMACGLIVSIYKNIIDERPHHIFAIIWSVIILLSTWQHIRYEYYLAINIALLSAICISFVIDYSLKDFRKLTNIITDKDEVIELENIPKRKNKKSDKKSTSNKQPNYGIISIVLLFIIFGGIFAYTSVNTSYGVSSSGIRMNEDWKESLEWMSKETPDIGVEYLTYYDKNTFKYPEQAYGVMSWWDYGHMITYIGKRIPNANPFQNGVVGKPGAATFFISTDESSANSVMDEAKTRYVMTDIEMDTGKFWAMATWYNTTLSISPYMGYFFSPIQGDPFNYQPILLNYDGYYLTMVSRLHNFDGSLTEPSLVYYVEYTEPYVTNSQLPTIVRVKEMNYVDAVATVNAYNSKSRLDGYYATIISQSPVLPTTTVPALQHHRLVHESPTNAVANTDIKYVKTFEYVKGAHIKGDGIIEIPIVTNTGRTFLYRQTSINGEFIVPYATYGTEYNVKAIGKYKIIGSDREYEVSEEEIMNGGII
jgi:dolichyl-diphosphooligosaccharide--protein glycosyltransferase